jgi:hypothetical protein
MFSERRQRARRVINRVAKFCGSDGSLPRDCLVVDLSETGARLFSEMDVPGQFTLSLSGDLGDERRDCRVVWRLGGELGVEFTDRLRR